MNGQRLGAAVRATRIRRRWRQEDLARRVGLSQSTVSRIERGHIDTVTVAALEATANALEIRLDLVPRWRGGDLDRLLNAAHSTLHQTMAAWFDRRWPAWSLLPEVSFAVYGERGVIDVLGWHASSRSLLVVELKTALVDLNELVGSVDRKRRLAPGIAASRGWHAERVGVWVVVATSRTNRRHVQEHAAFLRNAFPDRAADVRAWLRDPSASELAALSVERLGAGRVVQATARVRPSRGCRL